MFERSKVPLNKWLLCNLPSRFIEEGHFSAYQIHRMLGVTYKTAWFMCHRLREAMKPTDNTPLGGKGKTVESRRSIRWRLKSSSVPTASPLPRRRSLP